MRTLFIFLVTYFLTIGSAFAGLPPTTTKNQSATAKSTTFDFVTPFFQTTKTSGTAALIHTGNFNFVKNSGFEATSYADGWTASGGSLAAAATTNIAYSKGATWDSSGAGQTFCTDPMFDGAAHPEILKGVNLEASMLIKVPSGTSTHKISVYDGGTKIAEKSIAGSSVFTQQTINFTNPNTNPSLQLCVESVAADEPLIALDEAYLGLPRNIGSVSQAYFVGSIEWANTSNCSWSTTNASFTSFAADADCPTPTVTGEITAPLTNIPGFRLNARPGTYLFVAQQNGANPSLNISSAAAQTRILGAFRFTDGTNNTEPVGQDIGVLPSGTHSGTVSLVSGKITYTTAQSVTVQLQGVNGVSGTTSVENGTGSRANKINVYYYPSSEQTVYRPDQVAWRVDANISGTNPNLGGGDVTDYTGITSSGLTLVNNTGSNIISAEIPCSSTNAPSGTTCAAGDESVGVSFSVPTAGDVLACASFSHNISNGATGVVQAAFQIVETAANAQTILQEGRSRINNHLGIASASVTAPLRVCGTFTFASAGQKVLRLMYEQDTTATVSGNVILTDAAATVGQRDIHWEVYPLNYYTPTPLLVNTVVAPDYPGVTRINTIVSKSSNYTAAVTDETIVGSASFTLTLPSAASFKGKKYTIVTSATAAVVTVDPTGAETICGVATMKVNSYGNAITVQSDGVSNWYAVDGTKCFGSQQYATKSGAYTLTAADDLVTFTATATATLPPAADVPGKKYTILSNGSGVITVDGNSAETVCGSTTIALRGDKDAITIQSNGTNWWAVDGHTCYRTASARISSADAVSQEYPGEWLDGNCTDATTGIQSCTIQTGYFSAVPNCQATVWRNAAGAQVTVNNTPSATSIVLRTGGGDGTATNLETFLQCTGPR
jgi:hypothetical protein